MSQIFVSQNNSTTTPLGAGASFVGDADILTSYQEVDINLGGSPSVAPATLYFEFSPDGTCWDVSVPITLTGPVMPPVILRTVLPYFRLRYINGATPLTELRLTVVYHRESAIRLTRFLNQPIDANEPVEIVRVASGSVDEIRPATAVVTSVSASASSVQLLAANTSRKMASVANDSATATLYVKLGTTASASDYTVKMVPGAYFELPKPVYTGRIDGIWTAASGAARVTET